jgi:hypothetical protein
VAANADVLRHELLIHLVVETVEKPSRKTVETVSTIGIDPSGPGSRSNLSRKRRDALGIGQPEQQIGVAPLVEPAPIGSFYHTLTSGCCIAKP